MRDDLVAGLDAERHQREQQRVGARRHADGVLDAEQRRQLALEARRPPGPMMKRWLSQTRVIAASTSSADGRVLRAKIEQRNAHGGSGSVPADDPGLAPHRFVVIGIGRTRRTRIGIEDQFDGVALIADRSSRTGNQRRSPP